MSPEENYRQRIEQINENYHQEVDRIYREYYQRNAEIEAYYTPRIRACTIILWVLGVLIAASVAFILCNFR